VTAQRRLLEAVWPEQAASLVALAAGMGLKPDAAADVLQEVYLTALRTPPPIASEVDLARWLFRVTASGRGDSSETARSGNERQGNVPPHRTPTSGRGFVSLTTDDALRRIALLEQQARLESSLAHLPDDPWFADRRAANEQLLDTFRAAAAASDAESQNKSNSKETL
jgi:DNA-directed RNA polymerase specialized sigma24 family protein